LALIVTLILSLIGILDEYHQSFFANRTGNDPGDWLADTLGALCGALVFRKLHRRLL
jgi:VanZ family protein